MSTSSACRSDELPGVDSVLGLCTHTFRSTSWASCKLPRPTFTRLVVLGRSLET